MWHWECAVQGLEWQLFPMWVGFYYLDNQCLEACSDGYFQSDANGVRTCTEYYSQCATCENFASNSLTAISEDNSTMQKPRVVTPFVKLAAVRSRLTVSPAKMTGFWKIRNVWNAVKTVWFAKIVVLVRRAFRVISCLNKSVTINAQ
jgi:hypothetical protein